MLKLNAVVLSLTVAVMAVSGAVQARSLDEIIKSGTLRVGINPNFPPMSSYNDQNELTGFDIDAANEIARNLNVKAEFVPTESAQRVPFLQSDRIDISLGALTRNSERAKLIDFTVPLHTESMAVLTTEKLTASNWKELDSPDVKLVNMRGNWSVDYLKKELPKANVLLVETIADTVRAVAQGRGDAIVENIDFFMGFTKNYPDVKWKVLKDPISVGYDCIGVAKNSSGLRDYLNVVLFEMHSSGFVNSAWQKAYGAPMLKPVDAIPYF
ncbi:transporter substrate-binding domain-containing protein [Pseudomonas sp. RIT-PI-AD]|uniref:transporter substrate-binding domain-containing protein n=1 Tax=Pseudomonas sp. RIT-PI-AD TaxID=3035294 RepID=UPI0021DA357D|nr:transporter substrate-binding domain-containing protein [Pseudomonas sp. RIT-PI-AD]